MSFTLPGASDRTVVLGATGTGKTVLAVWLLSMQRFDKRPWVIIDYKDEVIFDNVGSPPIRPLKLGQMPGKLGLYKVSPRPDQDEDVEDFLWKIWAKGDIGIFCDEITLLPKQSAFKAILRQGRSKLIPVISCAQRPVDVDREVFTESNYKSVFRLEDERDYKIVQGFSRNSKITSPLPEYWSYWYDSKAQSLNVLRPAPAPEYIQDKLKRVLPRKWSLI